MSTQTALDAAWAKYSQRINYQFPTGAGSYSTQVTAPVMALIGFRLAVMDIVQQTCPCAAEPAPPVVYPCNLDDLVLFANCAVELDEYKKCITGPNAEQVHAERARIANMIERLHDAIERIAGPQAVRVYGQPEEVAA